MTGDLEKLLHTVWPDWEIVEPIVGVDDETVYKARRQDIVGLREAAIRITAIPEELDDINDLKMNGLSDDAVRLHLEQLVREKVRSIQMMEVVKDNAHIQRLDDYKVIRNDQTGQWFLIVRMELLTPLRKRLQLAPFTEEDVIRLGVDMCSALVECHRNNIVHMSVEPGNVFVGKDGGFKLGGFSHARDLTKSTREQSVLLHPQYTAPEVYKEAKAGLDIDAYVRMDIYSLGLVMYYLANNRKMPFIPQEKQLVSLADREAAFIRRISGDPLPGLTRISREIEAVILKACAFRMEERYASAAEMGRALLRLTGQDDPAYQMLAEQSCRQEEEHSANAEHMPAEQVGSMLISMEELVGKPVQPKRTKIKWWQDLFSVTKHRQ